MTKKRGRGSCWVGILVTSLGEDFCYLQSMIQQTLFSIGRKTTSARIFGKFWEGGVIQLFLSPVGISFYSDYGLDLGRAEFTLWAIVVIMPWP